ncbi:MAG TPA: transcription elongation factor GreA [Rickettsiales bacterium]|nr:transcription elongation factor GreA [Rickettsiales bacterium]
MKITKEGFEKLKITIDRLKNIDRPAIIQAIAAARELGDLKENAEYHSAKDKQGFIEAQISDYEEKIARAEVVDISKLSGKQVYFGATILLENLDNAKKVSYKIVSEFEADIDQGLISDSSPVARALIGKSEGDEVEINIPSGVANYEITTVKYI